MATNPARTLADHVRGWSAEQLGGLLVARPDLAAPAPGDSAQLAARASTRASVLRAVDRLDRRALAVLEAVASMGPVTHDELVPVVPVHDLERVLGDLAALLLIWDDGRGMRAVSAVVELLGVPAGPDPRHIAGLLAEIDEPARALLDHLDSAEVDGSLDVVPTRITRDNASTAAEHLLARGLLVARDQRRVTLPWSVRLALRGGRATREAIDAPPEMPTSKVDGALADRIAAGAAAELAHRVEILGEAWGTKPPAALRAGGLGVRDLRATATLLHVEPETAALVVEVSVAAGLFAIGMADELDAAWLPTDRYDAWLAGTPASRWAVLAHAWLSMPRRPSSVGSRPGSGPVNALSESAEAAWLPAFRRRVLGELAELVPGSALAPGTGLAGMVERLRWKAPRQNRSHENEIEPLLTEAAAVGLVARGSLSSFGRALVTGADAGAVLDALMPPPVDHLLLQADLTAVAPGPLESGLARRLALLADVESRGGATVYRFAADSVRRAFDAGWSAAEVHVFLEETSRTPVPQALTYLVDDVARRFGVLRAGVAESFLRSDDDLALTELMHHPEAASLRLRRIAPTVVISDVPLGQLLPRVRELGFAPVVEAPDGTVRVARADGFRARTPKTRGGAQAEVREQARVAAVVSAVRAGDRAAATRPARASVSSPADVITLLRGAAEAGEQVVIGYVGNDGTVAERMVRPLRVEGGRLSAYDERADDDREFAIHRITAAAPVA